MNKTAFKKTVGEQWFEFLESVITDEVSFELEGLKSQYKIKTVYPKPDEVWNAFVKCPFDNFKAVILGMDPYPNGEGNGLCFAVRESFSNDTPPSFDKLLEAYTDSFPTHFSVDIMQGNLDRWANEGVLLLNSHLTVEKGKPGSHKDYWEKFTKRLISKFESLDIPLVATGKVAESYLSDEYKSKSLIVVHPSYAARQGIKWDYKDMFNWINSELKKQGKTEIQWKN